jgi:hypothetical protein
MNDPFCKRVRAAAVAGWWTALVAVVWVTAAWLIWLGLLKAQPNWLLQLWGGGNLTWDDVQRLVLWFIAVAKLGLWAWVLVAICLTIWARKLKQAD